MGSGYTHKALQFVVLYSVGNPQMWKTSLSEIKNKKTSPSTDFKVFNNEAKLWLK